MGVKESPGATAGVRNGLRTLVVWHMAKAGKDLAVAGLVVEAIPFGSGFLTFPMSELTPVECVMAAFAREACHHDRRTSDSAP